MADDNKDEIKYSEGTQFIDDTKFQGEFRTAEKVVTRAPKPDELAKKASQEKVQQACAPIPEPDVQSSVESGKPTSSFAHFAKATAKGTVAIAKGVEGIAEESLTMTGAVIGGAANMTAMTANLTTVVIGELTNYVTKKITSIGEAFISYTMQLPAKTAKYTASYVSAHLQDELKAIKDKVLSESNFSKVQIDVQSQIAERKKKLEEKARKNMQFKGVEKIQKALSSAQDGMKKITSYISEGPSWVEDKVMTFMDEKMAFVDKNCDETISKIGEAFEKKATEWGEATARDLIAEQKKATEALLKKQLKKIEKAKKKAEAKMKAAQAKAVLKICELVGM